MVSRSLLCILVFLFPVDGFPQSRTAGEPPVASQGTAPHQEEITFGQHPWKLSGALLLPRGNGPHPAVVLVHGSGPYDRDESLGRGKPFKDLAWGLARKGLAVLRYDKRTRVHADRFVALGACVTVRDEVMADAVEAFSFAKRRQDIQNDRIFLLGHSMGGYLLPRIAADLDSIAGLIIMAGNARPIEDLYLTQTLYLARLDGEITAAEQVHLQEVAKQVRAVKAAALSRETLSSLLPFNIPASYWLDLRQYDPVATALKLDIPILVQQGERDYQVTMQDFAAWRRCLSAKPTAAFRSYPGLNHMFIAGRGKSRPAEYGQNGHVEKAVIDDIAHWIGSLK